MAKVNAERNKKICRLYQEDLLSTKEIGKRVGLSFPAVRSVLIHSGIKTRGIVESLKVKYPNGSFGKLASNWKGGRRTAGHRGYVRVYAPDHPRAVSRTVFEHIIVAEKKIGRYLKLGEIVHHVNHDKSDNRPENLEVYTRGEHVHHHFDTGNKLLKENERLKDLLIASGIDYN